MGCILFNNNFDHYRAENPEHAFTQCLRQSTNIVRHKLEKSFIIERHWSVIICIYFEIIIIFLILLFRVAISRLSQIYFL